MSNRKPAGDIADLQFFDDPDTEPIFQLAEEPVLAAEFTVDEIAEYMQMYSDCLTAYGYQSSGATYTMDQHRQIAQVIGAGRAGYQWAIGDHLLEIREQFGELTEELLSEFALWYGLTEKSTKTLRNYVTTSENWGVDDTGNTRRVVAKGVSYSHHVALNGQPLEVQNKLILKVGPNRWSVKDLVAEIAKEDGAKLAPVAQFVADSVVDSIVEDAVDNVAPGASSSSAGASSPAPDNVYEKQAEAFSESASGYDWKDAEIQEPKDKTFKASLDPLALADQIGNHYDIGAIAILVAELRRRFNV